MLDAAGGASALIAELQESRRKTRKVRLIVTGAILAIFAGWILAIASLFWSFKTEKFQDEAIMQARRVGPKVAERFLNVGKSVIPAYADAIGVELEKSSAELSQKFDEQAKIMESNVTSGLEKVMQEALDKVSEEERTAITEAWPDLKKDPKKVDEMVAGIREAYREWASRQMVTTLHKHVEALLDIQKTLASFKPSAAKAGEKGAEVSPDELLGVWLELVYEKLGGDEGEEAPGGTDSDGKKKG